MGLMLLKINHLCACLGLLIAASANAASINYTIQFTTTSGTAPTSGSFTYDATTSLFSNFLVEWDIYNFDLTAAANAPTTGGTAISGCTDSNGATTFQLLSHGCGTDGWVATVTSAGPFPSAIHWFSFQIPQPSWPPTNLAAYGAINHSGSPRISSGAGNWTIIPESAPDAAVPEPGSLCLLASGVALAAFLRKAS